jgi:hypothetical protein
MIQQRQGIYGDKTLNLLYVRILCGNSGKERKPMLLGMTSNKYMSD